MMLDNLRSDHNNNKAKLCTIPNGYPLTPHNGTPSSIEFPTMRSLKITREDHAYHLKSSNFSASLIGKPFIPGFDDYPLIHGPITGSPCNDDDEKIDITDETINAIVNQTTPANGEQKETSKKRKKNKNKKAPISVQTESTEEQSDAKSSTIVEESLGKEKEEKEMENSRVEERTQSTDVEKIEKEASSEDDYLKAAKLYPELYDGNISDVKEDSGDDFQEMVGRKRRRKKKPVVIPSQPPPIKSAQSPPQQRPFGRASDKHDVKKISSLSKSTQPPYLGSSAVSTAGPSRSVKANGSSSGSTGTPTVGFTKPAWPKPNLYPPSSPAQTKSRPVPQRPAPTTALQHGHQQRQPVPGGSGFSKPATAPVSGPSLKQHSASARPQQSQLSKTLHSKDQHPGKQPSIPSTPSDQVQLDPQQHHPTTSKPVHRAPEHHVPIGIKSSRPNGQQSSSSESIHQMPTSQKRLTQQTHGGPSKLSQTETQKSCAPVQPQPSTSRTVEQTSALSKMPQRHKPTVSGAPKVQNPVQPQPSKNVHKKSVPTRTPQHQKPSVQPQPSTSRTVEQTSAPSKMQQRHKPTVSGAPKAGNPVQPQPSTSRTFEQTSSLSETPTQYRSDIQDEDFDPSTESSTKSPEYIPRSQLEMMNGDDGEEEQERLPDHMQACIEYMAKEWAEFEEGLRMSQQQPDDTESEDETE